MRDKPQGRPPLALWVIGPSRLDDVAGRAAAIVGTRACTAYGEHVAADLSAGLAEHDVAIVSGGAYGIDGAAHRAALATDGVTVAVLAGGVDVLYPAGHSALLHRIASNGLLISEYPPGVRPARHRFLTRNRLVAALSGATVVVEAGLSAAGPPAPRHGPAHWGGWSVRCPDRSPPRPRPGCHVLLRAGAELVTRADEVRELSAGQANSPMKGHSPLPSARCTERYRTACVRGAAGAGRATPDEVAVASGLPAAQVLGPLAMLELAGLVQRQEGRWQIIRKTV